MKLTLADGIVMKEIDNQTVLFSKRSGDFFGINETATLLLAEALKAEGDPAKFVAEKFQVPHTQVQKDLDTLLESLEEMALVKWVEA